MKKKSSLADPSRLKPADNKTQLLRVVVETPKGTRLCRPSEKVLDLLPNPLQQDFTKEDGEVVRIAK